MRTLIASLLLLPLAGCTVLAPAPPGAVPVRQTDAAVGWTTIGHSLQRRPIHAAMVGGGPRRVYLIGLIHGDETEGQAILDEAIARLAGPDLAAAATVRVVRDMNPDGSEAGRRGNARGVDLNRNWPARNFSPSRARGPHPLSEPETLAVFADLVTFRPDLVIVLHSTSRGGPFVNYDGPAEALAESFASAAASFDPEWRTRAEMGYPTPGSLGTCLGVNRGVPILTIEFARGRDGDEAALAGLLAAVRAVGPAEAAAE